MNDPDPEQYDDDGKSSLQSEGECSDNSDKAPNKIIGRMKIPNDRSESRRGSAGSRSSIVLGQSSRRSRSRTRGRGSRRSQRSSAAHHNGGRDSERCRSAPRADLQARSPPRAELQARSRSRSVVQLTLQRSSSRAPPTVMKGREPTNRFLDESFGGQRSHRLQTPRRGDVNRSRSPVHSCINERFLSVTPQPTSVDIVNNNLLNRIKESLQSISAVNSQIMEIFNI